MRRTLRLSVLALALALAAPAAADEGDDIRAVVADQIQAFGRADLDAAYAHAAPRIQSRFRDPASFGRMVERGYPMIHEPGRWEMRELEESPLGPVQTVIFEDRSGTLWEADYLMERVDGVWRIAGVSLRQLPGISS